MINLICFDLWNTLYENMPNNPKMEYIYNLIYKAFDYRISINQIVDTLNEFDSQSNNVQHTNLDRLSYIEKQFDLHLSIKDKVQLDKDISNSIIDFRPILNEGVIEFLEFCRCQNHRMVLVSDTNYSYGVSIRIILKADNLIVYFDDLIFSDETKLRKPNPIIFQSICKKFHISPNHCLFIGDSEKKDIIGAKNCCYYTAKKCNTNNLYLPSEANTKFTSFFALQKEFLEGGIFYGV